MGLVVGFYPGSGYGACQAVEAGAHDPLSPEMLQGLSEQHRGGVVLDGPNDQPVTEGFPLAAPTGPPTGVGDDHLDVLTPGALGGLGAVADTKAAHAAMRTKKEPTSTSTAPARP